MASLKNDIFISYAHLDNKSGWVDAFHASLENWLGVLGVKARIWRDAKLRGDDLFSDEILDQLKSSALLLSIVSPNGMKSNWCEKERQKFEQYAEANGGFRIGNVARALKVVMTPADGDAHRSLFGAIGYEFFEKNSQSGRYDHYLPTETKFEKRVDQLAQDIKELLPAVAPAAAQTSKPAVYVAEVSSDLQADRTKVADQLTAWGFRVVPSGGLHDDSQLLRSSIEGALADAVLSVHLFSEKRGAIPGEEEKSLPVIQYELANARKLDRIVWISPGKQPHASIDAALREGSAQGLERLEGQQTVEDLKDFLAAKLNGLNENASKIAGPKLNVYVICDSPDNPFSDDAADRDHALQLKSYLDSRGCCVWFPPGNVSDQGERDKDHLETLKMSDAVILYWGVAKEPWFRGTLRALTKVRTTKRQNNPFAAEAIYFSSPSVLQKSQYRSHLSLAFDQYGGFRPEALRPFLERLQSAREAAAS